MNLEIPLGFGMALARDIDAMNYFTSLSEEKQRELIAETHSIKSKQEMRAFVAKFKNK